MEVRLMEDSNIEFRSLYEAVHMIAWYENADKFTFYFLGTAFLAIMLLAIISAAYSKIVNTHSYFYAV